MYVYVYISRICIYCISNHFHFIGHNITNAFRSKLIIIVLILFTLNQYARKKNYSTYSSRKMERSDVSVNNNNISIYVGFIYFNLSHLLFNIYTMSISLSIAI